MSRIKEAAYQANPYVEQYQGDRPGTQRRGFGAFMQGFEAGYRLAIEEAAKAAADTSALTTQPGDHFDEGYSQGRYEAGLRVKSLADEDSP